MRKSRKELEQELNVECNARMLAELRHRHQVDENIRLQQRLNELLDENNRLRTMIQRQATTEGDYLLREEVKSVLMKHGKELENSWHGYAAMIADVLALRTHEPQEKESNEYIDGYADAMQDMEKFLEEKKNLSAEVGSDH